MKTDHDFFTAQFFVCTNKRANGKDCASKGAEKLRDQLKAHYKNQNVNGLRINASGCLGRCEEGIACVMYPQGLWAVEVQENDQQKLIELIDLQMRSAID